MLVEGVRRRRIALFGTIGVAQLIAWIVILAMKYDTPCDRPLALYLLLTCVRIALAFPSERDVRRPRWRCFGEAKSLTDSARGQFRTTTLLRPGHSVVTRTRKHDSHPKQDASSGAPTWIAGFASSAT